MPAALLPALLAVAAAWCLTHPDGWIPILDDLNLALHEAGHLLFLPLPENWVIAGGSILQVLVPLAFSGSFAWRGQWRSAAAPLAWAAQSLLGVARYAADARARELELLTGDPDTHDWWVLLDRLDLLEQDQAIARGMRLVAMGMFAGAVVMSWRGRAPRAEHADHAHTAA